MSDSEIEKKDFVAGSMIPGQYRVRCENLVTFLEDGKSLYDALQESNLTDSQLSMCMRRDSGFATLIKEITVGVTETQNRLRAEMVKGKAFELAMKGEVVDRTIEVDRDGNETGVVREKRKYPERLMTSIMAAGDGAFRTTPIEAAQAGVVVNLNVSGVDMSVLTRKMPGGETAVAVSVTPTKEPEKVGPFIDVVEDEENTERNEQ